MLAYTLRNPDGSLAMAAGLLTFLLYMKTDVLPIHLSPPPHLFLEDMTVQNSVSASVPPSPMCLP